MSRLQRGEAHSRPGRLSSLYQREISNNRGQEAVRAWEQAALLEFLEEDCCWMCKWLGSLRRSFELSSQAHTKQEYLQCVEK